jgi:hypothetical protein
MKIFDFEHFKKGEQVGDAPKPGVSGPTYHDVENKEWVHIAFGPMKIIYREHTGSIIKMGGPYIQIKPENFSKECICFCTGKMNDVWEWEFVCTKNFFEKHKKYILSKATRRVSSKAVA